MFLLVCSSLFKYRIVVVLCCRFISALGGEGSCRRLSAKMIDISLWLLLVGLGGICFIFYKKVTKNEEFFAARGVPYIKPKLIFGSSMEFFFKKIELIDFIKNLYDALPNER